jgi:hypothetical protein
LTPEIYRKRLFMIDVAVEHLEKFQSRSIKWEQSLDDLSDVKYGHIHLNLMFKDIEILLNVINDALKVGASEIKKILNEFEQSQEDIYDSFKIMKDLYDPNREQEKKFTFNTMRIYLLENTPWSKCEMLNHKITNISRMVMNESEQKLIENNTPYVFNYLNQIKNKSNSLRPIKFDFKQIDSWNEYFLELSKVKQLSSKSLADLCDDFGATYNYL